MSYIEIVKTVTDSSDSQVFSMTILVNAKLTRQNFSNLVSNITDSVYNMERILKETENFGRE